MTTWTGWLDKHIELTQKTSLLSGKAVNDIRKRSICASAGQFW